MDVVADIAAGAAGLAITLWAGFRVGRACRRLPAWRYWLANGVGLLAGVVVAFFASQTGYAWLWAAALAVMAGSVTGLKYGLGRSTGTLRIGRADDEGPGSRG